MDTYKQVIFEPNGVINCKVTATLEDDSTKEVLLPNQVAKMFLDLSLNSSMVF